MHPARRLDILLWAIVAGLVAVLPIARRMWLVDPIFAPLPAFGNVSIDPPFDWIVYAGLLGLLLPIPFVRRRRRHLIVAFGTLLLLRGVWDQVAWQPWLLQYCSCW